MTCFQGRTTRLLLDAVYISTRNLWTELPRKAIEFIGCMYITGSASKKKKRERKYENNLCVRSLVSILIDAKQ